MSDFVESDTGSIYRPTLKNKADDAVIDLTGATITLKWRNEADTADVLKAMTIIGDPTAGVVEYKFLTGELYDPVMSFEIGVLDAGGFVLHSLDAIRKTVRTRITA